jgi:hypothetical protein
VLHGQVEFPVGVSLSLSLPAVKLAPLLQLVELHLFLLEPLLIAADVLLLALLLASPSDRVRGRHLLLVVVTWLLVGRLEVVELGSGPFSAASLPLPFFPNVTRDCGADGSAGSPLGISPGFAAGLPSVASLLRANHSAL